MESTLIILKPDCVDRRLAGEVIGRFERKGLRIVGMKMQTLSRELATKHYSMHADRHFFGELLEFITGGPVVIMALRGMNAIQVCRQMMGATAGHKAEPGTIRGDFGLSGQCNLVHGSDSPESAQRELELFFRADELQDYDGGDSRWFV